LPLAAEWLRSDVMASEIRGTIHAGG
jgi:hypothetical protein